MILSVDHAVAAVLSRIPDCLAPRCTGLIALVTILLAAKAVDQTRLDALIGWIISMAARDVGRTLSRAAHDPGGHRLCADSLCDVGERVRVRRTDFVIRATYSRLKSPRIAVRAKQPRMLSLLLASFVTFFVAIDPVAMAPMFTTMTSHMNPVTGGCEPDGVESRWRLPPGFCWRSRLSKQRETVGADPCVDGCVPDRGRFAAVPDRGGHAVREAGRAARRARREGSAAHQAEHPETPGRYFGVSAGHRRSSRGRARLHYGSPLFFAANMRAPLERTMVLAGVGANLALLPDRVPGGGTDRRK